MSIAITRGKLKETCLWQKRVGFSVYGEAEHDDEGRRIACRRADVKKLVRGKRGADLISANSYLISEEVRPGDLIDGCAVLSVAERINVYGNFVCYEALT